VLASIDQASSDRAHPSNTGRSVEQNYRRLMELVSRGFSWADAELLAAAPVSLACIVAAFAPES